MKIISNKNRISLLVTGAGGFIGSNLCRELLKRDYNVIGLYHTRKDRLSGLTSNKHFRMIKIDLSDYNAILKITKKLDIHTVFHTAAFNPCKHVDSVFPYFNSNTLATLNLLEACRISGIGRIVYSSSMSLYGNNIQYLPVDEKHPTSPDTLYSLTKFQGEELCRLYANQFGMKIYSLRYSGVYGPGRDWGAIALFISQALKNKPIKVLSNIEWDIIHVKDVVKCNYLAFKNFDKIRFEIINVGVSKKINIRDIAKFVIQKLHSKSQLDLCSYPVSVSFKFYYNINKANRVLNFHPTKIEDGLSEYIEYEKKRLEKNESTNCKTLF